MNMALFSTLFIFQFVGHRIGDYLLQGNDDAVNKAHSLKHLFRHCVTYTLTICVLVLLIVDVYVAFLIGVVTLIEHLIVDQRRPVVGWKTFLEKKLLGNKEFEAKTLPFFVLIEIDQSFHIVRIFLISLILAYLL